MTLMWLALTVDCIRHPTSCSNSWPRKKPKKGKIKVQGNGICRCILIGGSAERKPKTCDFDLLLSFSHLPICFFFWLLHCHCHWHPGNFILFAGWRTECIQGTSNPWTPLRMSALPADKMNALCGWSQKSGMNLVPGALRALSFGDLPHRTWSFRTQDAHTALPDVVVNHGKCSCDPKDFLVYFYTQFS